MPRGGGDTKAQILTVAMRLFVEQGYDKTSLREIADELGVTKAALYYHFRTKDDIVRAAVRAHSERVSALIDEAATLSAGPQRFERVVDSLLSLFTGESATVMQFGQANPTALARDEFGSMHLDQVRQLVGALAGPEPTPEQSMRAMLAFGGVMMGALTPQMPPDMLPGTDAERRVVARKLAVELLTGGDHSRTVEDRTT